MKVVRTAVALSLMSVSLAADCNTSEANMMKVRGLSVGECFATTTSKADRSACYTRQNIVISDTCDACMSPKLAIVTDCVFACNSSDCIQNCATSATTMLETCFDPMAFRGAKSVGTVMSFGFFILLAIL